MSPVTVDDVDVWDPANGPTAMRRERIVSVRVLPALTATVGVVSVARGGSPLAALAAYGLVTTIAAAVYPLSGGPAVVLHRSAL